MNAKKLQDELDTYKRSYKQIVGRNTHLEELYKKQEDRIAVLFPWSLSNTSVSTPDFESSLKAPLKQQSRMITLC